MHHQNGYKQNSSTHSQPSSLASEHPKSLSHTHPAYQTQGTTRIPVYVGNRSQRTPSVERRTKSHKSHSRETSQDPSPISHDPKSDQRSPEDDSSLFSISGMTSDNEYESNISESSGDASKPTQRDIKGYKLVLASSWPKHLAARCFSFHSSQVIIASTTQHLFSDHVHCTGLKNKFLFMLYCIVF